MEIDPNICNSFAPIQDTVKIHRQGFNFQKDASDIQYQSLKHTNRSDLPQ